MHRALLIEEVLDNIFDRLGPESQACVLRTCKAFFNPAARVLWREGEFGFRYIAKDIFTGVVPIRSDFVRRAQWKRLGLYSGFVRSIVTRELLFRTLFDAISVRNLTYFGHPRSPREQLLQPSELLARLTLYGDGILTEPLFPRLTKLDVEVETVPQIRAILLLLCSSLETLVIRGRSTTSADFYRAQTLETADSISALIFVLSEAVDLCPRLTHLHLPQMALQDFLLFEDAFTKVLRRFTILAKLTCDPETAAHPTVLTAIGALRGLQLLETSPPWVGAGEDPMDLGPLARLKTHLPSYFFPSLSAVRLTSSVDAATALLNVIPPENLVCINFCTSKPAVEHMRAFAIACCRFSGLKELNIESNEIGPRDRMQEIVSWETLSPILLCQKVEILTVSWSTVSCVLAIQDSDFCVMARSWPCLRTLLITFKGPHQRRQEHAITLKTLAVFGEHCPELRNLTLPDVAIVNTDGSLLPALRSLMRRAVVNFQMVTGVSEAVDVLRGLGASG